MEIIKVIKEKLIPFYHDYLVYNNLYPYSKYQQKYKCIYIHIPKTAGTSILNKLNNGKNVPRNHAFWKEYYKRSPHYYRKYFKFSFVRNPWDRAVSTYFYIKQSDAAITLINKKILRNIYEGEISTFEHFVLNFLNKDIIYSHSLLIPQWFYIFDDENELQVDFLGKYENLELDFMFIMSKLKLNSSVLTKMNTSTRKNYKEYYTNKSKEKIANLYAKDIELFNYKF